MNPAFWSGRRVLVTGHTGFKGSWLTLLLGELGARVTGFALAPPRPSLFEIARVGDGIDSVLGDLCDLPALEGLIARTEPEVVFHLAAQALVRESYSNPLETYRVNVMGSVTLLESLRRVPGRRAVVMVTSDKCYENREWLWGYRESDTLGGRDPYSNSKACSELVTSAYRTSFFAPKGTGTPSAAVATARAGNVIGGGDWAKDRLIPDIVNALSEGRPARIRNPRAYRPWQHVLDALRGYVALAEKLQHSPVEHAEAWNFGPSDEHVLPVGTLADDICSIWGEGARWEADEAPQPHEATRLMLDSAKSRVRLGLPPNLSYRTAISMTIEWYRAHRRGVPMREFTLSQIRAYRSGENQ